MLVIGLTGGIATGKSTASAYLLSKGIKVLDLDLYARDVVQAGTSGLRQIIAHFGPKILFPDGSLDRKALGQIIFSSPKERAFLNSITHPAIRRKIYWNLLKLWLTGEKFVVIDSPLLIETGFYKWMGEVVLISCSEETQLKRLMERDKSLENDAKQRLQSQISILDKQRYADVIINNDRDMVWLESQIEVVIDRWRLATSGLSTTLGRFMPLIGIINACRMWLRKRKWQNAS